MLLRYHADNLLLLLLRNANVLEGIVIHFGLDGLGSVLDAITTTPLVVVEAVSG